MCTAPLDRDVPEIRRTVKSRSGCTAYRSEAIMLSIYPVLGLPVSAVVAMLAILRDLVPEITCEKTHAAQSGLSISHHAVEPIAIGNMALLVLFKKGTELLFAGKVTDFLSRGPRFTMPVASSRATMTFTRFLCKPVASMTDAKVMPFVDPATGDNWLIAR